MSLFDDEPEVPVQKPVKKAKAAPPTVPTAASDSASAPLAARMRPQTLDEIAGQKQLLAPSKSLRVAIERDKLSSALFFGPPGCGKSTVALVIAAHTSAHFVPFSAVTGGVADVRKIIDAARERRTESGTRTLLFVDEIHRFNKAQQDAFLPHVEDGTILLIGATTENPYFSVNAPLLSRARIYRFEALDADDVAEVVDRALSDTERGLGGRGVTLDADARAYLCHAVNGDARAALTGLEIAANLDAHVTLQVLEDALGRRSIGYDKDGDQHYDITSAFIKSIRGSDPDASVYYLARMIEAGEDARFIARRLVILASEDVGNADPLALPLAVAAFQATESIGYPECALNLSQATLYLASAPKSNACTVAIGRAREDVKNLPFGGVPKHLRDSHYRGAKALGHGTGYKYPHDFPGNFTPQEYLPEDGRPYYEPTENGAEAAIKERLLQLWQTDDTPETI